MRIDWNRVRNYKAEGMVAIHLVYWRAFSRKWGRKVKETILPERMMTSESIILHPKTREELENFVKKKNNNKLSEEGAPFIA